MIERYRFAHQIFWALSSVGSEHLPYKQGVAGSNPAGPTKAKFNIVFRLFLFFKKKNKITNTFFVYSRIDKVTTTLTHDRA